MARPHLHAAALGYTFVDATPIRLPTNGWA